MSGLDSLYAMLARPTQSVLEPRRTVEQVNTTTPIAPDSHEAPQSQLPPKLERRRALKDERDESSQQKKRRASDIARPTVAPKATEEELDEWEPEDDTETSDEHKRIDIVV
jgi:hypothetical protein